MTPMLTVLTIILVLLVALVVVLTIERERDLRRHDEPEGPHRGDWSYGPR